MSPKEKSRGISLTPQPIATCIVGCYQQEINQNRRNQAKKLCEKHLQELTLLVDTFGGRVVASFSFCLRKKTPKCISHTYISQARIQEIIRKKEELSFQLIIFDEEITPGQQRNLEKVFRCPVFDRTELILEVFHQRAQTKEARLQVDLAREHYLLPRLKRMWGHLSRQKGGKVCQRGEGEKQLELDKRMVRQNIARLEKELHSVQLHRKMQRKARKQSHIPIFAIIGYTNAGKSTLLHFLTQVEVFIEDKLFATLDTTTRKYFLPSRKEILLIDTVGFIRKLPHTLVAAFRSTLEESLQSDFLLHLVDASDEAAEEQITATEQVLEELGAKGKERIILLNKVDRCTDNHSQKDQKAPPLLSRLSEKYPQAIALSAKTGQGIDIFLQRIEECSARKQKTVILKIPQNQFKIMEQILHSGKIISQEYVNNDILVTAQIPSFQEAQFAPWKQ